MPLSLTDHGDATSTAVDSVASSSFTPSDDSLVVAIAHVYSNGAVTPAISGGGLTWTERAQARVVDGGFMTDVRIWTAPVTTGASMTVTVSWTGGSGEGALLSVVDFTGYDESDPVGGVMEYTDTGGRTGAFSEDLDSAPASGSYVIGGGVAEGSADNIDPGTGWTAIYNVDSGDLSNVNQYRTGSTDAAFEFDDLDASFNTSVAAIEIQEDTGGGGGATIPPIADYYNRLRAA
jgi:hypothetical protein